MLHVVSWSGGKDSTATVILLHEHAAELLEEGDKVKVLFVEVMFDKQKNISGINQKMLSFIKEAKAVFESWGFEVEILRSDLDFLDLFYHRLTRSPDPQRVGLVNGFPQSSICHIKRDCKLRPLDQWKKRHEDENMAEYVGIAVDEPERLESLRKTKAVSLLERYDFTEQAAKDLCNSYGLLSPTYQMDGGRQKRDGCWFCPNAKLCEHQEIYEAQPKAWEAYVALEDTPNLAYPKWNCYSKQTLKDRDRLVRCHQMSLFEYL